MNAAYTSGAWRVGTCGPNGCYTVGTERGLMVAIVVHSVNYPNQRAQAIGDANLIAAAPKLLQAAKFVAFSSGFDAALPEKMEALRAAIAEAEGGSL